MDNNSNKLILKHVKILFKNEKNDEYKSDSITLWISDDHVYEVDKWSKDNNLGKYDEKSKSIVREYRIFREASPISIITCKLRHNTEIIDSAGQKVRFDDLAEDSFVDIVIRAYSYDSTEFGQGVSCYASSIMVTKAAINECHNDAKELLENSMQKDDDEKNDNAISFDDKESDFQQDDIPF